MFLLAAAGADFIPDDVLLRVGLAVISLIALWASVGSAIQGPGFRDPPPQDGDAAEA